MATERYRARRIHQYPRVELGRRRGAYENLATVRIPRNVLRSIYRPMKVPAFLIDTSEFADVVLSQGEQPILGEEQPFTHNLGEDLNSRERQAKIPDWYPVAEGETVSLKPSDQPQFPEPPLDPPPLPSVPKAAVKPADPPKPLKIILDPKAVVRNLPKSLELLTVTAPSVPSVDEDMFEERYSSIDVEMEKKLKIVEEDDESIPEWAQPEKLLPKKVDPSPETKTRKFSVQLLQSQISKGDPFAKVILENGQVDLQGYAHVAPYSLPLEKGWFYKDPQMQVQGPFTSIEMYSWNLMGYFSMKLLVAWRNPTDFRTLEQLVLESSRRYEESPIVAGLFEQHWTEYPVQRPQNAKTLHEVEKAASPTKSTSAYNEQFPAFGSSDADPTTALKSMLGIKTETKQGGPWGLQGGKQSAKSMVEIQREQKGPWADKRTMEESSPLIASPPPLYRFQSRPDSCLQVSPRTLYCRRKLRPLVISMYRADQSPVSPARMPGASLGAKGEYWHRIEQRQNDRKSRLSTIVEKLGGKRRGHSRKVQSEVDQRMLSVKGVSPVSRMAIFEQTTFEKIAMERVVQSGRQSAISYIPQNPRRLSPASAGLPKERHFTSSPRKRYALRPLTSEVKSATVASEQTEETYDDLTAWD